MSTSRKLKVIAQKKQFPLLITQEISNKIRFLCKEIHKVEWSGVLFYKIEGDIKEPETFRMEVKDIFLMDKGTSGYTEYNFDEHVAGFMMDKVMTEEDVDFMTYRIGHIHSHNSMSVFFSGTDWAELYDNCENHTFYLSLIVNNSEDMIAKLVYRGLASTYTALDAEGNPYAVEYEKNEKDIPDEVLFDHDCILERPQPEFPIPDSFKERLATVLKESEEKVKAKAAQAQKSYPQNNSVKPTSQPWLHSPAAPKSFEANSKAGFDIPVGQTELFHCFVLRFGEKFIGDTLLDALDAVALQEQDPTAYTQHIIDNFGQYYSRFYGALGDTEKAMDEFILSVEVFNDELEELEGKYAFLPTLRTALQQFSDALQEIADEDSALEDLEEREIGAYNQSFNN